jgi:16S rRNA (cytosine1402-N4)-methyltransferase
VLLDETLEQLAIREDGIYFDCTFGRGGHSRAILGRLGNVGRVLAMDRDPEAIAVAGRVEDPRFSVEKRAFSQLENFAEKAGVVGKVNGVLFDLGVSSPQFDEARRGFSFSQDGPLDMRMDPNAGVEVSEWLAHAPQEEIARVLKQLGDERLAGRIARAIVEARAVTPIRTTRRLAEIVARVYPARREEKIHPATRTFLALRMFINRELEELEAALPQAVKILAKGGRLVVISFQSLEDRIVKRFMRREARGDDFPPDLPVLASQLHPVLRLVGRAIRPTSAEVAANPRARSAVLRVAEKVA